MNCLPSEVAAVLVSGLAEEGVELDELFLNMTHCMSYKFLILTLIVSVLQVPSLV